MFNAVMPDQKIKIVIQYLKLNREMHSTTNTKTETNKKHQYSKRIQAQPKQKIHHAI
jgi:hypothetical protein